MSDDYRKDSMPKKSIAANILNSYGSGEPYIEGVAYTAFGRKREAEKFEQTLKLTASGSGTMEMYIGDYGVGKSFVLALFQSIAIKKGFVVMTSTIDTRSRYFAGSSYDKQGLALYRSLVEQTAVKGATKGGAFDTILENWYEDLKSKTDNGGLPAIYSEFDRSTRGFNYLPMYSDVRAAIFARFKEISEDAGCSKAIDFFLANYTKKSDASEIGAKDYIKENTWFNILNTYSHLFVAAGYRGLVVLIDQVDFLTSLPKIQRHQNYDMILSMWNQIDQGRTEYLTMCLFGSSKILYDKNGVQSNQPLYMRVEDSYTIETLPSGEMVALLARLLEIHEFYYDWKSKISEEQIREFIDSASDGGPLIGNCVRPISKRWVRYINELQRTGSSDIKDVLEGVKEEMEIDEEEPPVVFKDD